MASHQFGIMQKAPIGNYNEYEPKKYKCVSVYDGYLEPLLTQIKEIKCYHHSLDRPGEGLAYWGITLIPPSSLEELIVIISGKGCFRELEELLLKVKNENKYVIHFGI